MASGDVKRGRFFWNDLNQFCRDFISTQGRRPDRDALARAFEEHKEEWFVRQGKPVPSIEDCLRQAKGVRLLNEQRQYMAQYRREKKAKQGGGSAAVVSSDASEEGADGMDEEDPLQASGCAPSLHLISRPNSAPSSQTSMPPTQPHMHQPAAAHAQRACDVGGMEMHSANSTEERPVKRQRASSVDGAPAATTPELSAPLPPSSLDLLMAAACADAGTPGAKLNRPREETTQDPPSTEAVTITQQQASKRSRSQSPKATEPVAVPPSDLHALLMDQLQALASCSLKLRPPAPVLTTCATAGVTLLDRPAHQFLPQHGTDKAGSGVDVAKLKPTITSCGPMSSDLTAHATHMAAMRRRRGSSSGGSSMMSLGDEAAELLQQAAEAALGLHLPVLQGAPLTVPQRSGGAVAPPPMPSVLAEMQAVSAAAAAALAAATAFSQQQVAQQQVSQVQPSTARSSVATPRTAQQPMHEELATHPFRSVQHPAMRASPVPVSLPVPPPAHMPPPAAQHKQAASSLKPPIPEMHAIAPPALHRRSSASAPAGPPVHPPGSVAVPPPVTSASLPASAMHYPAAHPTYPQAHHPVYAQPPPLTAPHGHSTVVHHAHQYSDAGHARGHSHAGQPAAHHQQPYPGHSHMPAALSMLPPGAYPPGTIVTVHRMANGSEHIVVHRPGSSAPSPYAHPHHPPTYPHAPPPPPYPYPAYHGERQHEVVHPHSHHPYGYPPVGVSHHYAAGHPHAQYASYHPATPPYGAVLAHNHHAHSLPPHPPSVIIQEGSPTPPPARLQQRLLLAPTHVSPVGTGQQQSPAMGAISAEAMHDRSPAAAAAGQLQQEGAGEAGSQGAGQGSLEHVGDCDAIVAVQHQAHKANGGAQPEMPPTQC